MSYEGEMLKRLKMPSKKEVEQALLTTLFKHNGTIREFASGEDIVDELANLFSLTEEQRKTVLERIYKKENRIVKTPLWHRLLYRAADSLAKENFVTRPTTTVLLTDKKEWMLTEDGFDEALKLLHIPKETKEFLPIKSFEVQKVVKKIIESPLPLNYNPFDEKKQKVKITKESALRARGFRQAVIEAYDYRCAFCGMKINSPDSLLWEVEAAHIIPHGAKGKDDIWNGIALCHLHHWGFDVGWFTVQNDFTIQVSPRIKSLPDTFGKIGKFDFMRAFVNTKSKIILPQIKEIYPHSIVLSWHRENRFFK